MADLTETTYCNSPVFSVLVEAYREALARKIPYAILGLDRVLPLHPGLARTPAARVS
ncbi:hypothetical protein [Amycolatopsis sp. MEPSY49]|uniref:hypothetical protein n=1 Tax=Amycolatopsis sp. MEPSY49 TaxID=3151600 RepID=UPI003EF7800A